MLGIAAFIFIDGAIFHSGLYVSILAPSSYAGRVAKIVQAEKERGPSGLKEVLVLGDSRVAEGFSATRANEIASPAGLKFVSLAEPAVSANTWYYMVREADPTTRRYAAIVHLNAKGRQKFTETLVSELTGHLRSADSKG